MNSTTSTPPPTPPFNSPALWHWRCQGCNTVYKLSVTRRCLECTETTYVGKSRSPPNARRRRIRRYNRIPLGAFDYEYWTTYNDWRRFRSAYDKDPSGWKHRTGKELNGSVGRERRGLMQQLERKRRIEITKERRSRFIKATYSCDKDCDYPSQCHQERWAAYMRMSSGLKCPGGQVVGTLLPPSEEEDEPKSPLCGLLPELELDMDGDMAMTSPESIEDDDEIVNAYGVGDYYYPHRVLD
ncbi:hypothetical protein N0V84_005917 [Fusarium piperis]|uniref:Uncharacterized protein n=1 Tax=Fusarium piperis TaxID=1435070 RepID=A0A9W8WCS8_9HYPO|nr:hypothetical protein N0V84_005917 [Fusarium piperis]